MNTEQIRKKAVECIKDESDTLSSKEYIRMLLEVISDLEQEIQDEIGESFF